MSSKSSAPIVPPWLREAQRCGPRAGAASSDRGEAAVPRGCWTAAMTIDDRPAVVAFDGSVEAEAAVSAAASLFPRRRLVVVSVWEPGLALALASTRDLSGIAYVPPSAGEVAAIDRAQRDRATDAADAGVRLARQAGAEAEALPVEDEADVADTIAGLAERIDACAIVVGSRGLGGVKSRLLGS